MKNEKIRNIAIIAHVDHGKTSLVNELLKQGSVFRENQEIVDRVMDSNDIERERGITILSKNCSCVFDGVKINIIIFNTLHGFFNSAIDFFIGKCCINPVVL